MKDKIERPEAAGAAGAAGTAGTVPHGTEAGRPPMSAEAVAGLLRSEFVADKPEETPEEEVPEDERAGGDKGVKKPSGEKAETETEKEEEEEPKEGEEPEDETPHEEPKDEPNEQPEEEETPEEGTVPEALATAIAEWEAGGHGELPEALQGLVDRRIGKLTARAKQLEAEVDRLNQAVAEGGGSQRVDGGMLDEKTLNTLERTARNFVNDAEAFLDETATDEERARVEKYLASERLDEKGLKRRLRETQQLLTEIPSRRSSLAEFRKAEATAEPIAKEYFPWLEDKTSPEYAQAQGLLQDFPEIRQRSPAHKIALGIYVLGMREFQRQMDAKKAKGSKNGGGTGKAAPVKKGPSSRPPVKTPAAGAAAPVKVNGQRNGAEEHARTEFEKAPTRQNVTQLVREALRR